MAGIWNILGVLEVCFLVEAQVSNTMLYKRRDNLVSEWIWNTLGICSLTTTGDLKVPFTHSIYLPPKTLQYFSTSKVLSIHTLTIQYIGSFIYCCSVYPDIGWVSTVLLSYTATVCTLI